jgi:hypothetical protein
VVRRLNRVLGESATRLALRKICALLPKRRRGTAKPTAASTDVSGDSRSEATRTEPEEKS